MKLMYLFPTRAGVASIRFNSLNQRYHIFLGDEDLGSYRSLQHAVDDLSGGHTFTSSSGVDTATLGIPEDIQEWTRVLNSPEY